jgi:quinolinate synthase
MGYIEQIHQTINPRRAKAFCVEGNCICHKEFEDKKIRCMRQFGVCEKYEEIEF